MRVTALKFQLRQGIGNSKQTVNDTVLKRLQSSETAGLRSFFCRGIRLLHIKPLNLSAILCIKSLKYFNLCDKIAFIGIAHGDTGMRAAEASRRLVLFLLLRGVLK